jgi:hypothetical protein
VSTAMDFKVAENLGEFLSSCATDSFSLSVQLPCVRSSHYVSAVWGSVTDVLASNVYKCSSYVTENTLHYDERRL